jgi:TPP-dependent pyruvate/acetoin dehydrogenase alpha subunit
MTAPNLDTRLAIYRTMVECRQFETRAQELFFEGLVRGTTHLGIGQEAVAPGVATAMRTDDYTFCTYRGHNHTLARGVPMAPSASATLALVSSSMAAIAVSEAPAASNRARYIGTGSRASHAFTSPSGRYLPGSAREWPPWR